MKKALIAAVVIVILSAIQSHARPGDPATQFGCGRNTVAAGDPADKVIQYCGQPSNVQTRDTASTTGYMTGKDTFRAHSASHVIQTWTYNFGPRGGMVRMNFRDGILQSITDGGSGY